MDALFLRQVWAGNDAMLQELARAVTRRNVAGGRGAAALLPDQQGSVVAPGSRPRRSFPACRRSRSRRNFYPAGATKEEVQKWIDSLNGEAKAQATGFFTTIRRAPAPANSSPSRTRSSTRASSRRRRRCSARPPQLTTQPTLKAYLTSRADAFLSNDYYASDVAWMELDASIEPTIGPYEVYEDEWFNFKAAFEAFITLRDDAETKKLASFSVASAGPRERAADRSRSSAIRSSARSRPSASSTWSSPPAMPIAACRRPPSTCPTTNASSRKRAPSA